MPLKEKRRVVVTGLGMLSPLGLTVEQTWANLIAGQSGITFLEDFAHTELPTKIAGRVKDFDTTPYLESQNARKLDTFVQYAVAAATQALQDSALDLEKEDRTRIGVAVGSGIGGLLGIVNNSQALIEKGPRRVSPYFIPGSIITWRQGISLFSII
jgi:3-oxoacyl-[acyl-carrier-protein] synthase II